MSREPPCWSPDAASATVLMEYLKRASPEFVVAELDQLSLLDAADQAAAAILDKVAARRAGVDRSRSRSMLAKSVESVLPRKLMAMVVLVMCATIAMIAQMPPFSAGHGLLENERSRFMQLAGPTPEW